MKKIISILILSALQTINCIAQNQWQRTIGGSNTEIAESVAGTNDGGCVCTGWTVSFGAGSSDIYVVKFDAAGSLEWTRTFGLPTGDYSSSIAQTSDSGYILMAGLNLAGTNILKLNSSGELQWSKNITGAYGEKSIMQTSDGGFAIGCFAYSASTMEDFCLIKLNSGGAIQWYKRIGGDSTDICESIVQTADGGYALAGLTKSFGSGLEDVFIVKFSANGEFEWNCTVGGTMSDLASSIIQTADGGYLAVGITNSYGGGGFHRYIVKLNSNGTLQWTRTVSSAPNSQVPVIQTGEGGYVISGAFNSDMSIIKFSSSGDVLWNKTIGGSGDDIAFSIAKALDGGFFLAGYSDSFNGNQLDMYVVKLDSNWATCGYVNTVSNSISSGGIWGNPNSNSYSAELVVSDITLTVSSGGTVIPICNGGIQMYSISGTVRYQDNNQPVTSGYVKAVRFDTATFNIVTIDSAQIQSNGTYLLQNCPPITMDIMAYENDEDELSFVPTYYVSTINWENATSVKPDSNLTGINIAVKRTVNPGGSFNISGYVYSNEARDVTALKDAVIYARSAGVFKSHSISISSGYYKVDSLQAGIYELIADRMGYDNTSYVIAITNSNLTNINFYLDNVLLPVKVPGNNLPSDYSLEQNYPNPFNPKTVIKFSIPHTGAQYIVPVQMKIYDVLGREIETLVNGKLQSGIYEVEWDGSDYHSGIYFYALTAGNYKETRKMVLLK